MSINPLFKPNRFDKWFASLIEDGRSPEFAVVWKPSESTGGRNWNAQQRRDWRRAKKRAIALKKGRANGL